ALPQFLAGLEEWNPFFLDLHRFAGSRVAPDAGRAILHRKSSETAKFDTISVGQGVGDLLEYRVDDIFHVAQKKMRVAVGDALNELGLDHHTCSLPKVLPYMSVILLVFSFP